LQFILVRNLCISRGEFATGRMPVIQPAIYKCLDFIQFNRQHEHYDTSPGIYIITSYFTPLTISPLTSAKHKQKQDNQSRPQSGHINSDVRPLKSEFALQNSEVCTVLWVEGGTRLSVILINICVNTHLEIQLPSFFAHNITDLIRSLSLSVCISTLSTSRRAE